MSFRTVVISNKCKLSYKNNYMLIKNENLNMVHLSEINTVVIDTNLVSITSILLCEMMERKIKIIFCDERHNPKGEVLPYYGSHNTSKKITSQIKWKQNIKDIIWKEIIAQKIKNQSAILYKYEKDNWKKLLSYIDEIEIADRTNREGHSAKVYFNSLFGMDFTRDDSCDINYALDYGYSILLSSFNKEITSNGYLTQLGIHHKNEFNYFNLSSDLMEAFRPYVDNLVYENKDKQFDKEYKLKLIDILNRKVKINNGNYYLTNAISMYVKGIFKALENEDITQVLSMEVL
ncbi:type II CRISPR-associated endonuclease Cas1 [Paraclostridium ghonii]|uniref:CRISPR-associated endonuclease Cas1 n=1 Tax=Paraclostridium ghonii TaxID=29358 RepID=A0ABU0MZG5_9FIRM|nr:type II CRISPR-associated endonuclease Cas1 [Paeniclostridium ghonii]MDQ0556013.1 CRISPR-associated endonuclease Cas1 subtype II [Paeniclostridium ghonii]